MAKLLPTIPPPSNVATGEPSWRWRRIAFFAITGFSLLLVPLLGWLPAIADTKINETIVSSCFWLAGINFLFYSGFATTQDVVAIWTARSGRPYAANVQSVDPPPSDPVTVVSDKTTITGAPVTNTAKPKPEPDPPDGGA